MNDNLTRLERWTKPHAREPLCRGNLATSPSQPGSLTTCRAREEGQYNFLETELDPLERIGLQNYGLLQAEAAGGKEK